MKQLKLLAHALLATSVIGTPLLLHPQASDLPILSWVVPPTAADSTAVDHITAFHAAFDAAWRRSEAARHVLDDAWGTWSPTSLSNRETDDYINVAGRTKRINVPFGSSVCADDLRAAAHGRDSIHPVYRYRIMLSAHNLFGVCPAWFGQRVRLSGDERLALDHALVPEERAPVRAQREQLLASLKVELETGSPSAFVRGQFVRFAIDQGRSAEAHAALAPCANADWWCRFLRGYVHASAGVFDLADEDFSASIAMAPDDVRCRLTDVRYLFAESAAARLVTPDCMALDTAAVAWVWMLADPLWSVPVNERRVEHFVRHAQVILRGSLPRDERHPWDDRAGNDARRAMILRYGWPSYMWWNGPKTDSTREGMYSCCRHRNGPYTAYQYLPGRMHLIPSAAAAADPFSWHGAGQSIMAPPGYDSPDVNLPVWFPVEHFAPPYSLVPLPEGQTALLRRQSALLLATATMLDGTILRRGRGSVVLDVQLLLAHAPDSVVTLAHADGRTDEVVVLAADIAPRPAVLSVELSGRGESVPAARARYGITPPAALDALAPGAAAISDPVLLQVPSDQQLPSAPDGALRWMRGSTTLPTGTPLGVYWETYGLAPDATVEHEVWVQRTTRQGPLRRLGMAIGLASDRNTPVAVQWTESRLGPTATDVGGPVHIIGRTVVLDLGALPPGEYTLEVAARSAGVPPVRGQRRFTIQ